MKKILSLIIGLQFFSFIGTAFADDFVETGNKLPANNFILDSDNTGGDVQVQFGDILGEYIQWNDTDLNFEMSDDLDLSGTIITLDANNTDTGNNVSIIANQGTDNDGQIRYNASTDQWEFSNNGGAFTAFGTGTGGGGTGETVYGELYVTGNTTAQTSIGTSYVQYTTGWTVGDNDGATPSATNSDITIDATGVYLITFSGSFSGTANTTFSLQIQKNNGATPLSDLTLDRRLGASGDVGSSSISGIAALTENDTIELWVKSDSTGNSITLTEANLSLELVGSVGGDGHTQNTDTGTSANTFTIDNDNTATDVTLEFGAILTEKLYWDNSESRFTITDDLRIEGSSSVIGQLYLANDHTLANSNGVLNIGINGSVWENLTWNDASDQFELSDDLNLEQNQLKEFALENLISAPSTPVVGQVYYNTVSNKTFIWNGTEWRDMSSDGWNGSLTTIKLTPMDFQTDDGLDNNIMDPNGRFITEYGTSSPIATIPIPLNFRATDVMIYGNNVTNTVNVFAGSITDGSTATPLGNGNIGTLIDITDTTATTTDYITISVDYANGDQVYGGYITIEAVY